MRHVAKRCLFSALLLFVLVGRETRAQALPLLDEVHFSGNTFFSKERLAGQIRTSANRRFLDIPGFTWWRWVYQVGASGVLGGAVGNALMEGGEAPARLDRSVLRSDVQRLRLFYKQEGFRKSTVRATVDTLASQARRVTFHIHPGPLTYIRRVRYKGLESVPPSRRRRIVKSTLLKHHDRSADTLLSFRADDQRFSEPFLHQERQRLVTALRNTGYADVTRDSVQARVYPRATPASAPDSVDVTLRLHPGKRYRMGNVHVNVKGPLDHAGPRRDTLHYAPTAEMSGGNVFVQIKDESTLRAGMLRRVMKLRPGAWYHQSDVRATKRRLEATGVFSYTDIQRLPESSADSGKAPRQPFRITLRTRPRHRIRFETFALQRNGVDLSTTGSEVGAGMGVSYTNANLFGNGEAFKLRTTGSLAMDAQARFFTSEQAKVEASLTYPYLVPPLTGLDSRLHLRKSRTRLSLSLLTARRAAFNLIIRGRGKARIRLNMQHAAPHVASFIDVLDLSISNPDTLNGFGDKFLSRLLGEAGERVDDPVQRARLLEDYTQPQIENALRYTLRASNVNPLQRHQGHSYEIAGEIGGNLPYLLDRFVFTPGTKEGTLPGLPFFAGERTSRLRYRRYVRLTTDLRQYRPLDAGTVLAGKLFAGMAYPIGGFHVVPFSRRFYSGGASSVRGWRLRELGPGATPDALTPGAGAPNLLGGDIKLEASAELRETLVHELMAARWIGVGFADAGNVWFGPRNPGYQPEALDEAGRFEVTDFYKEVGVGTGLGLRLDWEYVIGRLDLAVRAYDPARSGLGLFPDGLRHPTLHFGLGHTF